jgi:hypothetical protein
MEGRGTLLEVYQQSDEGSVLAVTSATLTLRVGFGS